MYLESIRKKKEVYISMPNLKMIRVQTKLDELFKDKIDLSDAKNPDEKNNKYYTRAIAALVLVMRCGIDYDVAARSITDGYHDMGIDAVYNDTTQKKLLLVQSKWRKEGTGSISQEEASTFVEGIKRIINLDFAGCNKKISARQQEIADAIRDMDYQIEMIFCHTGNQNMDDYAFRPVNELLNQVNEDDSSDLLIFVETKLQDIYEYLANGQNSDNIVLDDVLLSNWGVVEAPFKAYYGTIPVSAVGEWYNQYGNRLFAKNIRYYKGSTEVNQGIRDVLKNNPEKFFYYNNGIKILCKKITKKAVYSTGRETGLFALEGVSLVNGAQTTGVIGSVYAEMPEIVSDAKIFVQMIDLGDADEEQAVQITKLSNTQNRIDGKDFASLDLNQERLRMELSFGGIQYLYKSGAKIEEPERQISLDETIVSQACALSELSIVALVKRNVGALTENIEKAPYKLLFNGATNSFLLFNGVQVLRAVESCIAKNETGAIGRKRLVLVHGNRFLLHLVLEQLKEIEGFNTQYYDNDYISSIVEPLFLELWEKTYDSMEEHFPESYPAHIFKNVGRLKALV
ncbi:AIPR protein [Lactonifactor longoviformis DSM 17459]|uniref:AIPR protein n=3 Tax=Lactonifactor TaxID=420345 RepID=A0A1M5CUA7_9CLOT|nr:AIPR protein [Lactonifactor longoviformis DSM 17459]